MPAYEHVFLARQDLAQAQVDALAETATKIIEDNGGKVVRTETWGLRNIAYRIQKNRKAHFTLMMACAEICRTSAHFMLMGSPDHKAICAACAEICERCAQDCQSLGDMQQCVEACRRCAESCRRMAA